MYLFSLNLGDREPYFNRREKTPSSIVVTKLAKTFLKNLYVGRTDKGVMKV